MEDKHLANLSMIVARGFFGLLAGLVLAGIAYLHWQSAWVLAIVAVVTVLAIILGDEFWHGLKSVLRFLPW